MQSSFQTDLVELVASIDDARKLKTLSPEDQQVLDKVVQGYLDTVIDKLGNLLEAVSKSDFIGTVLLDIILIKLDEAAIDIFDKYDEINSSRNPWQAVADYLAQYIEPDPFSDFIETLDLDDPE